MLIMIIAYLMALQDIDIWKRSWKDGKICIQKTRVCKTLGSGVLAILGDADCGSWVVSTSGSLLEHMGLDSPLL